ncbi:DUF2905 domain-containing protein [Chlorobium sp.]|uniref:DUF2905 domain-containing protein n=1 Tax=Chlorobium sp. TaxID=1095 RepID=UPI002F420F7F
MHYFQAVFSEAAKILIIGGVIAVICGLLLMAAEKAGSSGWLNWFGNLPLDIRIERENYRFFFPLGTSIVLSLLLSLAIFLFNKFIR